MIHNALLPKDSTFPSLSLCAKKNLATDTAVYVRKYQSNGAGQKISFELNKVPCYTKWILMAKPGCVIEDVSISDTQLNNRNQKWALWIPSWMFFGLPTTRKY
ncbi:unnamed protein product [Hymenolepis diminuta]|uniref:Uncharacterized protein n=1 Tax=Hymenolepis diminuta TaxID=6216 RepID=A0A564Z589_HYMDI|nr:unnamed protein product [Hymenolepis diminuta]